jgi:hypothetical protein
MSTVRFFVNNKRISTAVRLHDGSFLQVYPKHEKFQTQEEWEMYWKETSIVKPVIQIQVTPTKETVKPRAKRVHNWICPACGLGPGNDHRMCICRAFNYSVAEWEKACGIRP